MGRFNLAQTGFDAGELSPKLWARTDLELYKRAAREMRNFYASVEGVAMKRPGSRYVADTYGSTGAEEGDYPSRLIPFIYSQTESYVIEINEDGFRFRGQSGSGFTAGSINPPAFVTIPPFTAAELPYIQYVQSADTLWIVHPAHRPLLIIRTGAGSFGIQHYNYGYETTNTSTAPFLPVNTTATTIVSSHTTGSGRTITLASGTFLFQSTHVGAYFAFDGAVVLITAVAVGGVTATGTIIGTLGSTTPTNVWYESAWSDYRGWPRSVCFYQDRICYGGTTTNPDTLWWSKIGLYVVIARPSSGATDEDGFSKTLLSRRVNQIQWLMPQRVLVVGTLGSEWRIFAPNPQEGFNADNCEAIEQTSHGSSHQQAYSANGAALFAQQDNATIREFLFNFESDAYEAENLSVGADHLTLQGEITGMAWHDRLSILWIISNGDLIGLTRDRAQKVRAWHNHLMGGSFSSGDPVVVSVCVVPVTAGTGIVDELWLCVKRTINSATRYTIEAIRFNRDPEDDIYLDGHVIEDTDGSTINGLDHLEGETVQVVTDGSVSAAAAAVASGIVTTQDSFVDAWAGLGYTARLRSMRPDPPTQIGSSQGLIFNVDQATVRFYKSQYAKIGSDADDTELVPFEPTLMDTAPSFFSGDKEVSLQWSPEIDNSLYVVSDQPLATHVAGFFLKGQVSDA